MRTGWAIFRSCEDSNLDKPKKINVAPTHGTPHSTNHEKTLDPPRGLPRLKRRDTNAKRSRPPRRMQGREGSIRPRGYQAVFFMALRYSSSTFFLAQGVLLKNFKLDLMLGSFVKHLIVIRLPNSSQPYCSTRRVRIISSVTPCKPFWGCSLVIMLSIRTTGHSSMELSRTWLPHPDIRDLARGPITGINIRDHAVIDISHTQQLCRKKGILTRQDAVHERIDKTLIHDQ